MGTYFVRDDETGDTYCFSYADIVTDGFRTVRTGERVRFLADAGRPGCAAYVVRLDLPGVDDYYP
jgi:cold shock CspA family protein